MKPSPERYLVALSPTPGIGGFTYANLDRALLALLNIRRRWPRAELRVIPATPRHQTNRAK